MSHEEALEQFKKECVLKFTCQLLEEVDKQFREKKEALIPSVMSAIDKLFNKISEKQADQQMGAVKYIHVSLLRTSLLEKKFCYALEAYDSSWYTSLTECQVQYEADWLSAAIEGYRMRLETEKVKYGVSTTVISAVVQENVKFVHQYMIQLIRYLFRYQKAQLPEISFQQKECLYIRAGEYKGFSEIVGTIDQRILNVKETTEWLKEREGNNVYTDENFFQLDLVGEDFSEMNYKYANFDGSNLTEAKFTKSNCIGTSFRDCNLTHADFFRTAIHDADFRGATLVDVNFGKAEAKSLSLYGHEVASFLGTDFTDANLENANFMFSQIAGANFTNANLKGAVFLNWDQGKCQFSEKQIEEAIWLD